MKLSLVVFVVMSWMPLAYGEGVKAKAKEHVARATELHRANKLREALVELKTAYALDPDPPLLYAMGQVHVRLGECEQAIVFYERFLATRPNARSAALAREAIDTCKTNPPPPAVDAPAAPVRTVIPRPVIEVVMPPQPPPPRVVDTRPRRPWYRDPVAGALFGSSVVTAVASVLVYRSAVADRERADSSTTYDGYASLIERARAKRAYAIGFGAGSAALATAGVLRLVLRGPGARDDGLDVQPTAGGAAMSWTKRF